jgi:hypothetical protein
MPTTNFYFNNYDYFGEQSLVESLITESIKIYGIQVLYMPRTFENSDTSVFGEDRLSSFQNAFPIEMYIKSVDGFEGEGDFLSKFGLEIRDEMTLTVSRRRFSEELYADDTTPVDEDEGSGRPSEGDLLYFPLNGKIFEVKFVEHESVFYQMGSLQTYDIKLELFEYSNEILSTGIAEIDQIGIDYSTDILDNQIALEFYTTFASAESRLNANVTVDRGEVTNIVLLYGGENYALAPDVTIEPPLFTSGQTATAEPIINANTGLITGIEMTDVGRYYIATPNVEISSAEKITTTEYKFGNSSLYHSNSNNVTVGTINIPNILVGSQNRTYVSFWYKPESNITANSSILYNDSIMFYHNTDNKIVFRYSNTEVARSTASAQATIDPLTTSVTSATITNVGLGYNVDSPPRAIFSFPDLPAQTATANAIANLVSSKVETVSLNTEGRYYQFSPDVTISGDGISNLTLSPLNIANGSLILNSEAVNEDLLLHTATSDINYGRLDFWIYIDPDNLRAGQVVESNSSVDWSIEIDSLRRFVLRTSLLSNTIPISTITQEPAWKFFSLQKPSTGIDGIDKLALIVDGASEEVNNVVSTVDELRITLVDNTPFVSQGSDVSLIRTANTDVLIDSIRLNSSMGSEDLSVLIDLDSSVDTLYSKSFEKTNLSAVATDGKISSISIVNSGDSYGNNLIVTISDPTGTNEDFEARGSVTVDANTSLDSVVGISISNNGFGYSTAPTIFIDEPIGSELISAGEISSNTWNHIYMETAGGFGIIVINANTTIGDVFIEELSGQVEFANGHFKYGYSNTDIEVTQGFKGYLDNVIINETDDSFFVYDIRTLPASENADLTDPNGSTTTYIDRFDVTTVTPTVNNGIVESISFTSGIGYENTPTITIGAPTGNAQSFRATAEAVRIQGVTTAVNVTYGGNFYTREPRVTFTGIETIGQILFEDGDTLQIEEFRVEDTVPSANNELFEEKSVEFIDFSEINPFSEGSKW